MNPEQAWQRANELHSNNQNSLEVLRLLFFAAANNNAAAIVLLNTLVTTIEEYARHFIESAILQNYFLTVFFDSNNHMNLDTRNALWAFLIIPGEELHRRNEQAPQDRCYALGMYLVTQSDNTEDQELKTIFLNAALGAMKLAKNSGSAEARAFLLEHSNQQFIRAIPQGFAPAT